MLSNDSRVQNWVHGVCEMLILWVQIQQDLDNSGANSGKDGSLGPISQPSQGWFWSQELALEFSPRSCNPLGRSHLLCGSGSHSWMTWSFSSYNNFVNTLVPVLIFKISFIKFFSAKNILHYFLFPWWLRWLRICLQWGRLGLDPWIGKIPWRREQLPTPVFWPGEFHGHRSLSGCSPCGCKESDMTEKLLFSLFLLKTPSIFSITSSWIFIQ